MTGTLERKTKTDPQHNKQQRSLPETQVSKCFETKDQNTMVILTKQMKHFQKKKKRLQELVSHCTLQ